MAATPPRGGPLSHLVVLDLTQFLSGPYATQILGDMGARVIKVEPQQGDGTRAFPPHFVHGDSAYYMSINRNKESVVLNLKSEEGKRLFCELAKKADVVIDNWRPGVTGRLGIDFDTLSALNPRIVCCSVTGFGQSGPYRDRPAYDMIVQALSGGMSLTGEEGGRPVRAGIPLGDLSAGMYGVIGILAALSEREKTGRGQFIDVGMLDVQISMLTYQAVYYLLSGEVPGPQDRGHLSIPTYRSFLARDGVDVLITAITEKMWAALTGVLERPDLLADERFATNDRRLENRRALWAILQEAFLQRESGEWLERLGAAGIPCAPVNTVDRALADPQVVHRDMLLNLPHPKGGTVPLVGDPVKFSKSTGVTHRAPPALGADTRSVLEEDLGLSSSAIEDLLARGVVGCADAPA